MSNKESLQQNNVRLSENNTDLDNILNTINELPSKAEINLQEKSVIPTTEQQEIVADEEYTGLSKVTVEKITENSLEVNPSSEEQNFNGVYTNITVAGDENLIADNIKEGVSIFGVEGNVKASNVKITDASYLFYNSARNGQISEMLSLCKDVTNTCRMFAMCTSLTTIDLSNFDTSKVTDMSDMFQQCTKLTTIDLSNFDTSKVTNMSGMFNYCSSLTELDLSNFDMSKVNRNNSMLAQCPKLTNLTSFRNLGKGYTYKQANYNYYTLDLSKSTNLTHDSLMSIINNLYDLNLTYDVANGGTLYRQKLNLGSTNLAKLQATEEGLQALADVDAKGWNVS